MASRLPGLVKLERALSKLGFSSRSQARREIEAGAVSVDGGVCRDPSFLVDPERSRIEHAGERIRRAERVVIVLHKRRGTVTTRADPQGRPTVFDGLPAGLGNLHAVGRLDFATSGLLLLTNDTRLSAFLTDPVNAVPRTYLVTVRGAFAQADAAAARTGVVDQGERLRAQAVEIRKASGRESHLVVTLTEGKNREIRRLFAAVGHPVTRLRRVAFGGLTLGELSPGAIRHVSAEELRAAFPRLKPPIELEPIRRGPANRRGGRPDP